MIQVGDSIGGTTVLAPLQNLSGAGEYRKWWVARFSCCGIEKPVSGATLLARERRGATHCLQCNARAAGKATRSNASTPIEILGYQANTNEHLDHYWKDAFLRSYHDWPAPNRNHNQEAQHAE